MPGRPRAMKVLLIGPLPAKSASQVEPIGGAKVTFAEAIRELGPRGFDLDIINTGRPRPNLSTWKILRYELLTFARGGLECPVENPARRSGVPSHVGLSGVSRGVHHLGPVPGAAPPPGAAVLR